MLSVFLPISCSSRGRPTSSNFVHTVFEALSLPCRRYTEYFAKAKKNCLWLFIYKRYLMSQNTVRKTWKVREGVVAALWAAGGGWVGGRGGWLTPETGHAPSKTRSRNLVYMNDIFFSLQKS
jgi:hypothetical protein